MEQTSDDSKNESKEEDNIQRLLEQNRINTQALRKLLKFIESKNISEDKPSDKSQEKVINNLEN
ncbi:MAG: hypothetical protein KG029_06585 [Bacteroidetes bacterium]|jgi:hypothetical protein|nr:hypothetical protein [Bacteroidota bacterium]